MKAVNANDLWSCEQMPLYDKKNIESYEDIQKMLCGCVRICGCDYWIFSKVPEYSLVSPNMLFTILSLYNYYLTSSRILKMEFMDKTDTLATTHPSKPIHTKLLRQKNMKKAVFDDLLVINVCVKFIELIPSSMSL